MYFMYVCIYVCSSYKQYDYWLLYNSHMNICAQVLLVSPLAESHFVNALHMCMLQMRYNNMRSIGLEVYIRKVPFMISTQNLCLPLNPFWHMHFLQGASSG